LFSPLFALSRFAVDSPGCNPGDSIKEPPRHVPFWLGKLFAGEMLATMMVEGRGASNAKAKRELDWQPLYPSWREGFVNGLKSAA